MASSVLKMQAASQGIQPSTSSSKGHWLTLVSPSPWSLSAWLTMKGGRMAWLWAPGTKVGAWCGTQQLWTLLFRATITIKTPPDRLVLWPQKKSWGHKMPKISWPPKQLPLSTSGNWDLWCVWQVHCPFLSGLSKKLVDVSGDPREHQWLHQRLSVAVAKENAASIGLSFASLIWFYLFFF